MPKYLITASYTAQGVKGLLKDGGTSRRAVVQRAAESVGGKLESLYFAFGDHDAIVICDLPDNAAATALSLTISATGSVRLTTTPLITAEEVDAAAKKSVSYRAPGA
ncbi:MAG: GYD domain protein [Acidobacteria bacterium]|nr:MAG: GYD domain protein [Acidobacteriota bacterium]